MNITQLREEIKYGLSTLPESNHEMFKRMYSPKDLTPDINTVVDNMPANKLQWALQQVTNTRHQIFNILKADYE